MLGVAPVTIRRHAKALGIDPKQVRRNYLALLAADAAKFAKLFDLAHPNPV
jgi:hypothetical protein